MLNKKIFLLLPIIFIAAGCNQIADNENQDREVREGFKIYSIANFTFEYPNTWQAKECVNRHSIDSEPFVTPDCALLSPVDIDRGPYVSVRKAQGSLETAIAQDGYFSQGITREELTIDGHKTIYIKTTAPTYTYIDNVYYVEDGDSVVRFIFREYEVSDPEGAPPIISDERQYLPAFQELVRSTKFE